MGKNSTVPLLAVKQWLDTWKKKKWADEDGLPEPPHVFYVGSMPIQILRRLAGVNPRDLQRRKQQLPLPGYQRGHQKERSEAILRYIRYGYPLSTQKGLSPEDYVDLVNPGWLPTAILVNVIPKEEKRYKGNRALTVKKDHVVSIVEQKEQFQLSYPASANSDGSWDFSSKSHLEPLEIIDGQHRLFAVDQDTDLRGEYNVPVVFFDGLPSSWQAYLFWVINVEPKKINTSLAFDLYPELRNQRWLERGEWIKVYQEHRAQELTEVLWRHRLSPWQDRIELHGRRIEGHVSNAAFIRSLMASFVRKWGSKPLQDDGQDLSRIGGLFGSIDKDGKSYVVPWKRPQQAAFLIRLWRAVLLAVEKSKAPWVQACSKAKSSSIPEQNPHKLHPAFAGPYTLLATDQGVRAISVVFNALCQVRHEQLALADWDVASLTETDDETVSEMLKELEKHKNITKFIDKVANELINGGQDWRTSAEPSISNSEKQKVQGAYRGSSGYALLQREAMKIILKSKDKEVASAGNDANNILQWDIR